MFGDVIPVMILYVRKKNMDKRSKILKVGIRGAGQLAQEYLMAIAKNPDLCLTAVCSRSEDTAHTLTAQYNSQAKVYTHYQKMLADPEIDVVVICTPNSLHATEAIQAFEAKKHLVLETPVAITYKELRNLRAVARKAETRSVVSFVLRWHPMMTSLKALLEKQPLGKIYYTEADYWYRLQPALSGQQWMQQKDFAGGAMLIAGCHAADITRYLTGKEVDEVFAYCCKTRQDFDYDTTFAASVKFVDGTIGKLSASLEERNAPYQFNLVLVGMEGAVINNQVYSKIMFPEQIDFVSVPSISQDFDFAIQHSFQQEIDNFTDHILNGTPILSDVLDACNSIEVALAIEESAIVGKPVKIIGM